MTRSVGIDGLRLFGIIAIIAGHSFEGDVVRAATYTWHVPVFFFLSGWLWKPGRTVGHEIRNRWTTLLRPYLFWLVLISSFFLPFTLAADGPREAGKRTAGVLLGGYFLKSPYHAFWFVTTLAVAVVLYRVIERLFPRFHPAWMALPAFGLTLGLTQLRLVPEGIGLAIPCLIFLAAGNLAARWGRSPLLVVAAGLLAIGLTIAGVNKPLDIKRADFGVPLLGVTCAVAIAWALVVVFDWLLRRPARIVEAVLTRGSALALGAALAHGVAVDALWGRASGWAIFIAALACGFGASAAAACTPVRAWALGRTLAKG